MARAATSPVSLTGTEPVYTGAFCVRLPLGHSFLRSTLNFAWRKTAVFSAISSAGWRGLNRFRPKGLLGIALGTALLG